MNRLRGYDARLGFVRLLALRAPVSLALMACPPKRGRLGTESRRRVAGAPRLPAAVGSAASEVMMLGSGEFVMLLPRCCLLLMLWSAAAAALRSGRRPTDEGVLPGFGGELDRFVPSSSRRNVLLGCTECAVRALSEKVRGGCVHSL